MARTLRRPVLVAAAAVAGLALTAGSCDERGLGDAPVGEQLEGERTVIVMPDRFPNLALVCDGSTAIYVTTREAAPAVVPSSEFCRDGSG